jgi:hypothetical protein
MVRSIEKLLQPIILALPNIVDMNDHVFGVKCSILDKIWPFLAIVRFFVCVNQWDGLSFFAPEYF